MAQEGWNHQPLMLCPFNSSLPESRSSRRGPLIYRWWWAAPLLRRPSPEHQSHTATPIWAEIGSFSPNLFYPSYAGEAARNGRKEISKSESEVQDYLLNRLGLRISCTVAPLAAGFKLVDCSICLSESEIYVRYPLGMMNRSQDEIAYLWDVFIFRNCGS